MRSFSMKTASLLFASLVGLGACSVASSPAESDDEEIHDAEDQSNPFGAFPTPEFREARPRIRADVEFSHSFERIVNGRPLQIWIQGSGRDIEQGSEEGASGRALLRLVVEGRRTINSTRFDEVLQSFVADQLPAWWEGDTLRIGDGTAGLAIERNGNRVRLVGGTMLESFLPYTDSEIELIPSNIRDVDIWRGATFNSERGEGSTVEIPELRSLWSELNIEPRLSSEAEILILPELPIPVFARREFSKDLRIRGQETFVSIGCSANRGRLTRRYKNIECSMQINAPVVFDDGQTRVYESNVEGSDAEQLHQALPVVSESLHGFSFGHGELVCSKEAASPARCLVRAERSLSR